MSLLAICKTVCLVCLGIIAVFGLLGFIAKKIGEHREKGGQ